MRASFGWFERLGWQEASEWGNPTQMPLNVREMQVRHPDGHVFRISQSRE
jgi:hypothetical protein